jgi:hypothetical protein
MTDLNGDDFDSLSTPLQEVASRAVQLTLIEFFGMCLCSLIAIPILLYFLWVEQERQKRLSVQLQINIGAWLFYMSTALVYAAPTIVMWKGQGK